MSPFRRELLTEARSIADWLETLTGSLDGQDPWQRPMWRASGLLRELAALLEDE